MLTHRPTVMRAGTAAIIFTAIALLTLMAYQGAAAQGGEPPQAPSSVMAHLIAGPDQEPQVRISWDAPDEGTVTSHTVNRDDGQPFQVTGGATTYSDREIEPGMSYSYTVTAQSDAGSSPASDPVAASIPAAPAAPGGLTATAADPVLADTSASVTITLEPGDGPPRRRPANRPSRSSGMSWSGSTETAPTYWRTWNPAPARSPTTAQTSGRSTPTGCTPPATSGTDPPANDSP